MNFLKGRQLKIIDKTEEELKDMAKNIIEWKDEWKLCKDKRAFLTKANTKYFIDELWKKKSQYGSYFKNPRLYHAYELQDRILSELEDEGLQGDYIDELQSYLKLNSWHPTLNERYYLTRATLVEKLIAIHRAIST